MYNQYFDKYYDIFIKKKGLPDVGIMCCDTVTSIDDKYNCYVCCECGTMRTIESSATVSDNSISCTVNNKVLNVLLDIPTYYYHVVKHDFLLVKRYFDDNMKKYNRNNIFSINWIVKQILHRHKYELNTKYTKSEKLLKSYEEFWNDCCKFYKW